MPPRTTQDRITGFWSLVATDYEAHEGNVPTPGSAEEQGWVDTLRDLLPPAPADVLDIGTGTGFVALIAAGLGHRVTGIDLSPQMLDEARASAARKAVTATFQLADGVDPALPAASFDAITCRHFLWTLRDPAAAFANWRRLFRPGGRLVAIDSFWFEPESEEEPAGDAEPGLFEQFYTRETRAALPVMNMRSPEPVVALLGEAGFTDIQVTQLTNLYALAEHPPGEQPWYVVTAIAG